MDRPEYISMKISDIPDEIIAEYKLKDIEPDGSVFNEVLRSMYGLPQSGLLSNELLEKRLNTHGYFQSKLVPGLWSHKWRPIQFTLVVDDFGVKYVGKEHAEHLQAVIAKYYKMSTDWTGTRYIGITLDWDYANKKVHLPYI
jgi:retron-type reverse transcriptase